MLIIQTFLTIRGIKLEADRKDENRALNKCGILTVFFSERKYYESKKLYPFCEIEDHSEIFLCLIYYT